MKCYCCLEEIVDIPYSSDGGRSLLSNVIIKECPGGHIILYMLDDKILEYSFFIDRDDIRYKVDGFYNSDYTVIYSKDVPATRTAVRKFQNRRFSEVIRIPKFVIPSIKDDILQADKMMDKLQKLIVFS